MKSKVAERIYNNTPLLVKLKVKILGWYVVNVKNNYYICAVKQIVNSYKYTTMHELHPKFLVLDTVEEGIIVILSKVVYHRDLEPEFVTVNQNMGGGFFECHSESRAINFYGSSHDFGSFNADAVKKAIQDNKVYANPYLSHVYDNKEYKFSINAENIN